MKIVVIDNYDSFVFNLVHILYSLGVEDIEIYKNDKIDPDSIHRFDKILLSPGPGIPRDAGFMPDIIKQFAASKSILGICLGQQAIAESFGGKLINMKDPLHGVSSALTITAPDYLFDGIPRGSRIGHYHSWVVESNLPDELEVLAVDDQGNIMAVKHKEYDLRGLQFHPESVLTDNGIKIIENWVNNNELMNDKLNRQV